MLIKMYLRNKKFELLASRQLNLVELNQQYLFHQALQQSLVDFDLYDLHFYNLTKEVLVLKLYLTHENLMKTLLYEQYSHTVTAVNKRMYCSMIAFLINQDLLIFFFFFSFVIQKDTSGVSRFLLHQQVLLSYFPRCQQSSSSSLMSSIWVSFLARIHSYLKVISLTICILCRMLW